MSKRTGVQTFRRENDRFWILACHPDQNLLAAGHDSGMIVFKLERERPPYSCFDGNLYYIKDRYLRIMEISSGRDVPLLSIRRPNGVSSQIRSLSYNPNEKVLLVCAVHLVSATLTSASKTPTEARTSCTNSLATRQGQKAQRLVVAQVLLLCLSRGTGLLCWTRRSRF